MKAWRIMYKPDATLLPQDNVEAESFMRPLKKILQACQIEHKDTKKELTYVFVYEQLKDPLEA